MKSGSFSITLNQRNHEHTLVDFWDNIFMASSGAYSPGLILREILTECEDFKCAVHNVMTHYFSAPGYFTIAGVNEAQVITRDHLGPVDTAFLNDTNWYLLQTNQDYFKNICLERCTEGRKLMDELT